MSYNTSYALLGFFPPARPKYLRVDSHVFNGSYSKPVLLSHFFTGFPIIETITKNKKKECPPKSANRNHQY